MTVRSAMTGLQLAILLGITLLLLVPTGMCVCAEHEDDSNSEQHEPGCPKIRKLDQPGSAVQYTPDLTSYSIDSKLEQSAAPLFRPVFAVGHGPPRGLPLYLSLQTLLI